MDICRVVRRSLLLLYRQSKITRQKRRVCVRSLELLTRAVKGGFVDVEHLQRDSDLEPIRERAEFKQLIETIKK